MIVLYTCTYLEIVTENFMMSESFPGWRKQHCHFEIPLHNKFCNLKMLKSLGFQLGNVVSRYSFTVDLVQISGLSQKNDISARDPEIW